MAVGFSSQSHMTYVFRRFMKTTPAAYRAEALGLKPNGTSPSRRDRVAGAPGCLDGSRSNVLPTSFSSS
jgi:AraC-like DNA-binding protein